VQHPQRERVNDMLFFLHARLRILPGRPARR
jgi:hypothetical protein